MLFLTFQKTGLRQQSRVGANKVDNLEQDCHRIQDKMTAYLEYNNKNIKDIKEQVRETV